MTKALVNDAVNNPEGEEYDEYRFFLMHTFWVVKSKTFARWFEWYLTVRTIKQIGKIEIKDAKVIPTRIENP